VAVGAPFVGAGDFEETSTDELGEITAHCADTNSVAFGHGHHQVQRAAWQRVRRV